MNKLTEIAKANGADVFNPGEEILGTGEFVMLGHCFTLMDADQLRATVEQVAGPLVEALKSIRSEAYNDDECDFFNIADLALIDYRTIIGDKE